MRRSKPNMSSMITSAIRNLRQSQGSTSKEIMNYIMSRYDSLEPATQRQMCAALKRGLDYGILSKTRGCYKLNPIVECELLTGGGPMLKSTRKRPKKQRSSLKKKKKGQTGQSRKNSATARSRSIATGGRNAFATLEANIPGERSQEQIRKDIVCCFENKWRERCENGNDSTDPSRSTLESDPEPINEPRND